MQMTTERVESWGDAPECDGTDSAHPAYWRGHDHAVAVLCQKLTEILDGKDDGKGIATEPWEPVRRRLLVLRNGAREPVRRRKMDSRLWEVAAAICEIKARCPGDAEVWSIADRALRALEGGDA